MSTYIDVKFKCDGCGQTDDVAAHVTFQNYSTYAIIIKPEPPAGWEPRVFGLGETKLLCEGCLSG